MRFKLIRKTGAEKHMDNRPVKASRNRNKPLPINAKPVDPTEYEGLAQNLRD